MRACFTSVYSPGSPRFAFTARPGRIITSISTRGLSRGAQGEGKSIAFILTIRRVMSGTGL